MRARLIKRLSVPIWTLGRVNVGESTSASHRNIGVWLGDPEEGLTHLQQAALYASETGGTLHLLHVVDEINEGSMIKPLSSNAPLGEEMADTWLRDIAGSLDPACKVEVYVGQGRVGRELPRLVHRSGVNILMGLAPEYGAQQPAGTVAQSDLRQVCYQPRLRSLQGTLRETVPRGDCGSRSLSAIPDIFIKVRQAPRSPNSAWIRSWSQGTLTIQAVLFRPRMFGEIKESRDQLVV